MFRFACSVVLWRGRGTADKYHWRVWEALPVFLPHWVCPRSWHLCFPRLCCSGSRLLYREQALSCMWFKFLGTPQERRLGWACVLCLSRLKQLRQLRTILPGCGAPYPLRGPSLSFCARFCARRSGAPCVCSGGLVSSLDPPGRCQPSRISGSLWLETGRLFAVW